ncbi:hypothetical protein B566_EDAN017421 [Ephemera danica]|nr:hypothetical protein B566_EDAN017421 [Ephemera danica]
MNTEDLESEAWKLKDLTETWRSGCQAALPDLLQHIRTTSISTEMQNLSMDSLLDHLNIPIELVHFDEAKHEFY